MTACMYREHARQDRESAHAEYCEAPGFYELEAKAKAKGYRHATISEINASAERSAGWAPDLYCWHGGLWIRIA